MANNVQSVTMTLDGNTYNLTSLDGITWTAQFQAPAGSSYNLTNGKYNATITAAYETGGTTTVSGSGSDALSQKARLAVYEQIKPTANVTTPTANAYYTNSTQTLDFTIVDNGTQASGYSGVKLSTLAVTLSSVSLSESRSYGSSDFTSAAVTGGYRFTKSVTLDDALDWVMTIDCEDNDGNAMNTVTIPFRVDTVAPLLSVSSPVNNLKTNTMPITVAGTTDADSLTVTVDGGSPTAITVTSGSFNTTLNLSTQGEHVLVFTASDLAGNTTTVSRTITYSTASPTITDISFSPDPAAAGSVGTITVTVVPYET